MPLALPPLNALRTFDAVARHLSMTNAAKELSVTQTAVSHQVRQLEDYLEARLLVRDRGRLSLTPDGRAWATALADVFARLHAANRRLRNMRERPVISITAIPSFAARWLVPHLGRFFTEHPQIDVRVSPSAELVDLATASIDLGIRYGTGRYPGLVTDKLLDDAWLVVSSPALAARVRVPADLRNVPLLYDDEPSGWETWLAARNVRPIDGRRRAELTDSSMIIDAAICGQGVALARWSLAVDALATGTLVRPFPRIRPVPTGRAYYLVGLAETMMRREVAAFRSWLHRELAASLLGRPGKRHHV
jgi:LysR family glycine cleavage system transcriptional activator